jgi:hypothetical protein
MRKLKNRKQPQKRSNRKNKEVVSIGQLRHWTAARKNANFTPQIENVKIEEDKKYLAEKLTRKK